MPCNPTKVICGEVVSWEEGSPGVRVFSVKDETGQTVHFGVTVANDDWALITAGPPGTGVRVCVTYDDSGDPPHEACSIEAA